MKNKELFMKAAEEKFGQTDITVNKKQIKEIVEEYKLKSPTWLINDKSKRVGYGIYDLSLVDMNSIMVEDTVSSQTGESFIPKLFNGYVKFGHFKDVETVIASNKFYPMFITGLSGNGKTLMVEQAAAQADRELIRANITIETDEDDLIGGMRLINGETVWEDGPVITAMKRGAILLLDEVDLASNKIMCLQPVLEGNTIYLKKINQLVTPAPGFNIIATANTKGKGSDDGRFVGTMVMNEAFLERFSITFEQEYPSTNIEEKILNKQMSRNKKKDVEFVHMIVTWADMIRQQFFKGGVNEIISTRRLGHIIDAYTIFGENRDKAIKLCLNRFDTDTSETFLQFYTKIDKSIKEQAEKELKAAERKAEIDKQKIAGTFKDDDSEVTNDFPF